MYKPRTRKLDLLQKRALWGWVFVAPFIIGFLLFIISPLYTSFMFSINEQSKDAMGNPSIVYKGFQLYKEAFTNDLNYITSLETAAKTFIFRTVAILLFSFIIANMLNQQFRGRTLARAIFFMPVVTATGVAAALSSGWEAARFRADINYATSGSSLDLSGSIMSTLQNIEGLEKFAELISQAFEQLNEIVMLSGVPILIFLAALQTISPSLFEASDIEGATKWEAFWKITFPMVSPMILVSLIYTLIEVLIGQRNPVMTFLFYRSVAGSNVSMSVTMAMGWIYFLMSGVVILIVGLVVSKLVYYENERT